MGTITNQILVDDEQQAVVSVSLEMGIVFLFFCEPLDQECYYCAYMCMYIYLYILTRAGAEVLKNLFEHSMLWSAFVIRDCIRRRAKVNNT